MWTALAILLVAIVFFITEWLRVDVVALGVVIALILTGLLNTGEAISGFSNPAVLTIASLFIVGGAVLQTGLAGAIGRRILAIAGSQPGRLTVVIMVSVALLSAVMSDTGTVAVLLPAIVSLSLSTRISTSKLLIPLSYGALLGGATTLIGTPPNIIVSDILREQGLRPFGFFDYTPIGLILLVSGVLFMFVFGRLLLPESRARQDVQRVETPEELVALYRLPDNLYRLRVRRGSPLIGNSLDQAGLRARFGITLLDILRPLELRSTSSLGEVNLELHSKGYESIKPQAETIVKQGDLLIAQGTSTDISQTAATWNLAVLPAQEQDESSLITDEVGVAEVLIPPRSSLVGKSLVDVKFGTVHHLSVLDIRRPGTDERLNLKNTELRFGDTLLVQGPWSNILALRRQRRDFVVMGEPEIMETAPARARAPIAFLVLVGMLVLMVTNLTSIAAASMLAALAMILSGCLSIDDAYQAVDWKSIVLVAGMLPMATALERVGLVNLAAQGFNQSLGELGPAAVLAGLFLMTSLFTQVLSNTATTVLVAPIGLAAAAKLGVQPYAFLMAIAIAASMAFATPVASPVNTLVMGSGQYRFTDYMKVGAPMILVTLFVSLFLLPLLWPFTP